MMKNSPITFSGPLLILLAAAACSGQDARAGEPDPDAAEVQEEVGEAWDALRQYAYDQRAELDRRVEEQLAEARAEIDELQNRAEGAAAEAGEAWDARVEELERLRSDLEDRAQRLGSSGAEAWGEVRDGAVDAARRLREALDEARASLEAPSEG